MARSGKEGGRPSKAAKGGFEWATTGGCEWGRGAQAGCTSTGLSTGHELLVEVHDEVSIFEGVIDIENNSIRHDVPHEDEADVHDVEGKLDVVLATRKSPPLELEQNVHQRRPED